MKIVFLTTVIGVLLPNMTLPLAEPALPGARLIAVTRFSSADWRRTGVGFVTIRPLMKNFCDTSVYPVGEMDATINQNAWNMA